MIDNQIFTNSDEAVGLFFRTFQKACFPTGDNWHIHALEFTDIPDSQTTRFGSLLQKEIADYDNNICCLYYDFQELEHYTHTLLTWQTMLESRFGWKLTAFSLANYVLQRKTNRCAQNTELEQHPDYAEINALSLPELQSRFLFYFLKSLGSNALELAMPVVMILDHVERLELVYKEIPYLQSHSQWLTGERGLISNCPNLVWVLCDSVPLSKNSLSPALQNALHTCPLQIHDELPIVTQRAIADSSVTPDMDELQYTQYLEQKMLQIHTYGDLEQFVKSRQFLYPYYLEAFRLEAFERCYHILKETVSQYKNTEASAIVMHFYSRFLYLCGMFEDALRQSKIAWNTLCRTNSAEALVLDSEEVMARCCAMLGDLGESLRLRRDMYETCLRQYGFAHQATATAIRNLALLYTQMGNEKKAEQYKKQLEECENQLKAVEKTQ